MSNDLFFNPSIKRDSKMFGLLPTEAVVIDVITNEEHPDYDELGFNVGTIRFKYIEYGAYLDQLDNAYVANPLDVTLREYPLIGEVVSIEKFRGIHYYTKRMNVNQDIRFSSYNDILRKMTPTVDSTDRAREIQRVRRGGTFDDGSTIIEQPLENENYNPRPFLHYLKHFDGDVVIQNRFGASLRFGSSQMESALNQFTQTIDGKTVLGPTKTDNNNNPIVIIRVGENDTSKRTTETPFALTVEDVNLDPSVFVLSSDQEIDFIFSTTQNRSHFRSSRLLGRNFISPTLESKTPLTGNQGILNSGRLIFNSKNTDVILSSNRSIVSLSNSDIISDAGNDNIISSTRDVLIRPENGFIILGTLDSGRGSNFTTDPLSQSQGSDTYLSVAIAEPLIEILDRLISLLTPTTAPGLGIAVTGQPIVPLWNPQMKLLSRELNKIRSNLVRIER